MGVGEVFLYFKLKLQITNECPKQDSYVLGYDFYPKVFPSYWLILRFTAIEMHLKLEVKVYFL